MKTLQLTLSTPEGSVHSVDEALANADGIVRDTLTGLDWLSGGGLVVLYRIEAASGEHIETELAKLEGIYEYDVTREDESTYSVLLHVAPEEPLVSLFELVERNALLIDRPISFTDDGLALRVVGTESSLQDAMAEIPDAVDLHLENTSGFAPGERTLRTRLTDRQQEAVKAALDLGYYETPRQVTYEEIAAALDCAPSTANELLRRAEGKLVRAIFDTAGHQS